MKIIDKVALLYVKDGKILSTRSKGRISIIFPEASGRGTRRIWRPWPGKLRKS